MHTFTSVKSTTRDIVHCISVVNCRYTQHTLPAFQLVVHLKQSFARLGLVHLVATNLCMWAMVVVMETAEAYKLLPQSAPDSLKGAPVVLPTPGTHGN